MADVICRWRNPSPKTVVEFVSLLPKKQMSSKEFRKHVEAQEPDFFHTPYQLACQLGLYYEGNDGYIPRFSRDITAQEAQQYLEFWITRYYAPNPFTRSLTTLKEPVLLLESLVKYLEDHGGSANLKAALTDIFKDPMGNVDIVSNSLNQYSKVIKVANDTASLSVNYKQIMEQIPDRKDKMGFFFFFDANAGDDAANNNGTTAQMIFYGCPGTGKSFKVKGLTEGQGGKKAVYFGKDGKRIETPEDEAERIKTPSNIFRTTFHPDYDYATFVGTYKPLMKRPKGAEDDDNAKEELSYDFVPQVFTKAYVRAWKSWEDDTLEGKDKNVFLIIEEINRGNCSQIFGDLFQLLDRKNGFSEFPIIPDAELGKYLKDEKVPYDSLRLPPNLHIYATMNTSDQSLFPMDSAFKRRWAMEYVPIKYEKTAAEEYNLKLYGEDYKWTDFLRLVNAKILEATNSEDKQMGEFFIKQKEITEVEFINKVMFYLWNDVCKDLFNASRMSKNYFLRDTKDTFFTFAELYSGRHRKNQPDKEPKDLLLGFMAYLKSEAEDNLNDQENEQGQDPMNLEQ